jgi:hypothetical protein
MYIVYLFLFNSILYCYKTLVIFVNNINRFLSVILALKYNEKIQKPDGKINRLV